MKSVLIFSTSRGRARAEMLKGVREFARGTDWKLHVQEFDGSPFPVKDLLSFWSPIGCIVEGSGAGVTSKTAPFKAFGNTPVVYLGCESTMTPKNATKVIHDATATANIAARELLSLDLTDFAFVGFKKRTWSERRKTAFCAALKTNGKTASTIEFAPSSGGGYKTQVNRLKKWLLELPKPCGLMAADDATAETILSICRIASIDVPNDIAIVGVDDNESICENTTPTLSSVRPDFVQGGRFAARLLARKIQIGHILQNEAVFTSCGMTHRGSTRMYTRKDSEVAAALERIWAPDGVLLTPAEILSRFSCSRRNAEIRFRRTTDHTVLQELTEARIMRAKKLLAETSLPVSDVASYCGYRFPAHFRERFRLTTGLNPLAWRKSNRG